MSDKLKPCPFCGTKPHPITADLLTRPCFYYECENKTCHAAEKNWHDTEQGAIDAWNTRPIEDALQARIAELETTLQEIHQHYDDTHAEEVNELNARIAKLENDVEKWKDGHKLMFDTAMKKDHEFGLTMQYANELVESKRRIAELEGKTMQCPRCGDPITNELGDNPICGACALASDLNAMTLQARIAKLEEENRVFRAADYEALRAEKLIYCAKCRDGIVADDDGICGVCAGAQDGVIDNLKKKVGEMARSAIVWHKYPNTKPFNSEEYLVISCGKYVIATWDFYAGRFIANDEFLDDVANWAYLPEPPDIACDAHIGKSATQAPLPVSGATQAEVDND